MSHTVVKKEDRMAFVHSNDANLKYDENGNALRTLRFHTNANGKQEIYIPEDQLRHLIESNFTVPQIAKMLDVSVRTIRRRMNQYGMSIRQRYTDTSDNDLRSEMAEFHVQFPHAGYRVMQGHLLSKGIR